MCVRRVVGTVLRTDNGGTLGGGKVACVLLMAGTLHVPVSGGRTLGGCGGGRGRLAARGCGQARGAAWLAGGGPTHPRAAPRRSAARPPARPCQPVGVASARGTADSFMHLSKLNWDSAVYM